MIKAKKMEKLEKFWEDHTRKEKKKRAFARTQAKKSRLRPWLGDQIGWGARLARGHIGWGPDWLGDQIGWEVRLAGRPDWLRGQIGLYLVLIIPYPSISQ